MRPTLPFLLTALMLPCAATAADFQVDSLFDDGVGSLRAAIAFANQTPGPDRIVFHGDLAGKTLWIDTPTPVITEAVEVIGPDGDVATVRSTGNDRVLRVLTEAGAGVTLRRLVLAGGRHATDAGGCLEIRRAAVLLDGVRLTECEAVLGGAVAAGDGAILELQDSRVDHSRALRSGGAIYAAGPLFIGNSEIDHNAIDGGGYISGGAIQFGPNDTQSMLWILDSRLHHNSALTSSPQEPGSGSAGGAVSASHGEVRIERSSFYANRAMYGAAVNRNGFSGEDIRARIVNSTFARNQGRQIVSILTGSIQLEYSTISDNRRIDDSPWASSAFDAWSVVPVRILASAVGGNYVGENGIDLTSGGTPVDAAYSLIERAGAGSVDPANPGTNLLGAAPLLLPLRWNGGPTPTMWPQTGGPLIDGAASADLPPTDQRGYARPSGAGADIGAVEHDGDRLFDDSFEAGPAD
ncbi:choice-of-anchor Q domain-containing protein [Dokdonella ginsengisoli]|uniref:Choice-of-anchor Q domain-containing protein n=1 Tax=Dokdonella ginsengisoli TaxID=363846 RepID=A0ABV9QTE0_9GAMM